MKNSNKNSVAAVQGTAPESKVLTINDIDVQLPKGRPVDPDSARQAKLARIAANGSAGKRGRPADPNSKSFKKKAGFAAKIEAGITVKRGRPADPTSARAAKIAAREAKILALKQEKLAELQTAGK